MNQIEVKVHSTLASCPGQVSVVTSPDQPVDSLIIAFCIDQGIRHRKEYVLQNSQQQVLDNTKPVSYYDLKEGDILLLGLKKSDKWFFGCNQWWLLAAVALFIGGVGIMAISILKVQGDKIPYEYGVVIDAGSSHSQTYVYKWEADKENETAVAYELLSCLSDGGGISSYTDDPTKAGESLVECLDIVRSHIPSYKHSGTEIYLGATAGMRLLRASDNATCSLIMQSVQDTIATYPFSFDHPEEQARILEGKEEGSFSWITANYLMGNFGKFSVMNMHGLGTPKETVGALDLGGASTQLTFVPENQNIPADYWEQLVLYGDNYEVYTYSYLCYGLTESLRQFQAQLVKDQNFSTTIYNPCAPKGNETKELYTDIFEVPCTLSKHGGTPGNVTKNMTFTFVGTSNSSECEKSVRKIFDFGANCSYSHCSFDGVFQPPVGGQFSAFSGYYLTMKFLNLTQEGNFTLEEFRNATDHFCSKTWQEVSAIPHKKKDNEYLVRYCFDAHYIDTLLTEGYGFNSDNWHSLSFQGSINNNELGWSLGYMLNTSNAIPAVYSDPPFTMAVFILLLVLFTIFLLLSLGFACQARRTAQKAPSKYEKLGEYGTV